MSAVLAVTAATVTAATTYRPAMTPAQYVAAVAGQVDGGEKCSARLAVLVLHAIADMADWQAWSWGSHSYRSAETIAASIGYTDRAVRYAYKALVDGGWLMIEDRPGRTNIFTVLAPVEVPEPAPRPLWTRGGRRVQKHLRAVDNPGDNPAPSSPAASVPISGGAETGAADLGALPRDTPPEGPPVARKSNADGADAPAQAPPRAAPPTGPPFAAAAPAPAGPGAKPHRRMRTVGAELERAGPSPDGPVAAPGGTLPAVRPLKVPGGTPRRDQRRRAARCDTCGAGPGEACRGRGDQLRVANHQGRGG